MTTTINKKFEVNEPIEKVWAYLTDPEKIVVCVPGASLREKIDDRNFKGGVTLKFGPVKASYDGEITFEEMDEANRKMTLKGKGLDSKGKGSADMLMKSSLAEKGTGTEVDCSMQISIVGKLAQFGARLINDVSDQLFNQFVNNFKNTLAADTNTSTVSTAAESVADAVTSTTDAVKSEVAASAAKVVDMVQDKKASHTISGNANSMSTKNTAQTNADNSLNAFSLMWAVVKGWFSRLFGGGK